MTAVGPHVGMRGGTGAPLQIEIGEHSTASRRVRLAATRTVTGGETASMLKIDTAGGSRANVSAAHPTTIEATDGDEKVFHAPQGFRIFKLHSTTTTDAAFRIHI